VRQAPGGSSATRRELHPDHSREVEWCIQGLPVCVAGSEDVQRPLSPDGRWIANNSEESGAREVYIQSFPPGRGKWQISVVGGDFPLWRNDGRDLFYLAGDSGASGKLMAVSLTIAGDRVTAATPQFLFDCPKGAGYSFAVTDNGRRFLVLERVKVTPNRSRS
jgi:hypothetical protein